MNPSFSPNPLRPNLPLRKPSSSPVALLPSRQLTMAAATPVQPAAGASGDGPMLSFLNGEKPAALGSSMPTAHFCNFCGQQGSFRCTRCKKMPYCSVTCQTEDWRAHRHVCKPEKENPKETTAALVTSADKASQLQSKQDVSVLQRVYLKDFVKAKTTEGTDMQVSCVEFYSPGRFFLVSQSAEQLETLQRISAEFKKAYSGASVIAYVPCAGEVCAVQYSFDMNWYRGLVQTVAADQKTAGVVYIDFGNQEDVPVDRIRPLAANIPRFPPCAMECQIAGVLPVDGWNWSGECCIALRKLLVGMTVTAKLVGTLKSGHVHAVDILLSSGEMLSTFLLQHGYAAKERVNDTPTEQDKIDMLSASLANFRRCSDGTDGNTWAQPPEPLTQSVGDSFSVVVTHLQSPSEIIVQKVENAGLIQQLQLKLREHCFEAPAPKTFRPAPGTVCCAQFSEDKQWYRAKVLAYSSEECVCVGYLDFGNSEKVDLGHLRPINPSLLSLAMQAMPCGLAGVKPVGESWSEECVLALKRRVSNRILRADILRAHDGKALVAMFDEASDPQANVAELLICAGYAAPAPTPSPVSASGHQQVDQVAAGVTTEAQASPSQPLVWSSVELPMDGQTVALLASVVKNPGEFFCRIAHPRDHEQMMELTAELKSHCEADTSPFVPKVGEPCCATLPGDGTWCRAVVTGQASEDMVPLNFVDYGYDALVGQKHLRSITPQLLKLPFQAVRCWLTGAEPLGSEWSTEAQLWFQTLVDGRQLSGRALSVTERGYGVELESRGQNVADALISEKLAHRSPSSGAKHRESVNGNVCNRNQTGTSSERSSSELPVAAPSGPSFPLDWKTTKLPPSETFQPYIAAVTSPSLFYLLTSSPVDQQKLQEVMMELAAHCSRSQASVTSADGSGLVPGAACCACFSADDNWYRAVVVDIGEDEVRVLYADYGNTEKVPVSRILPIPTHLLQLPFKVIRCTLTGREHFPAHWPEDVLQLFKSSLFGVLATVQSFDGSNVLSLKLPAERGGGHVSAIVLEALQAHTKSNPGPSTQAHQTNSITSPSSSSSSSTTPGSPQSVPVAVAQTGVEKSVAAPGSAVTPESMGETPQQWNIAPVEIVNEEPVQIIREMEPPFVHDPKNDDPQLSACCCPSLLAKINHLERLMQLQLSLTNQLVGQTK